MHAIHRQLGGKESAASFTRRAVACLQEVFEFLDHKEGRISRAIVRTDDMNSLPLELKEQLEKTLHALPGLFRNSDFTPLQNCTTLWMRSDIDDLQWPEKSSMDDSGTIPMLVPAPNLNSKSKHVTQ